MKLNEMIKNRADMLGTMRQFLDSHEDKNGNLNADDSATYAKMEADFDALTDSIKRAQRAEEREGATVESRARTRQTQQKTKMPRTRSREWDRGRRR